MQCLWNALNGCGEELDPINPVIPAFTVGGMCSSFQLKHTKEAICHILAMESQVYLSYMKLKTLFMSSFASGNIQFLVEIMSIPLINDIHQMSMQHLQTRLKICHFGDEQS